LLTESNNRFAIVDLGSNSFHLLLGSALSADKWQIDFQMSEAVQLRSGLTPQGKLNWESINRALNCLDVFASRLSKFDPNPSKVRIIGTAALRYAKNRDLFISHATKKIGYPIEVISGEQEAELIYQGFVQHLRSIHPHDILNKPILGIDVGGGSTELVIGFDAHPKLLLSLPIGCVELQSLFLEKMSVTAESFSSAAQIIVKQFRAAERQMQALVDFGWEQVYAGSGSAEILAKVNQFLGLEHSNDISIASLRAIRDYLITLGDHQAFGVLGLRDHQLMILPGVVAIFLALMHHLQLEKITVLPVSLRHGALVSMLSTMQQPAAHSS
jgi:exopolyphosphatase/guanosine-5'-triphosphate,3'-diphosphate pyrophosphatase